VTIEVQGLLFDMDGVLVSSIAGASRCWRRWAVEYGVTDAEKVEIPHGIPARDIAEWLVPGIDIAEGLRRIEDMEIEDVGDLVLLPGAKPLLEELPSERWAIVTSATKRLLVARLAAAGLPVPERLISADMVEQGKPNPEPYLKGAALLGFSASECLVLRMRRMVCVRVWPRGVVWWVCWGRPGAKNCWPREQVGWWSRSQR